MTQTAKRPIPVLDEATWRRVESVNARRERHRLISNGTIVPGYAMRPTPITRKDGKFFDQFGRALS